jgi:hypothetical protein
MAGDEKPEPPPSDRHLPGWARDQRHVRGEGWFDPRTGKRVVLDPLREKLEPEAV